MASNARRNGITLGEVRSGSRQTPQSVLLTWQVTNQRTILADGIVPFFIDLGTDAPSVRDRGERGRTARWTSDWTLPKRARDATALRQLRFDLGLLISLPKASRRTLPHRRIWISRAVSAPGSTGMFVDTSAEAWSSVARNVASSADATAAACGSARHPASFFFNPLEVSRLALPDNQVVATPGNCG